MTCSLSNTTQVLNYLQPMCPFVEQSICKAVNTTTVPVVQRATIMGTVFTQTLGNKTLTLVPPIEPPTFTLVQRFFQIKETVLSQLPTMEKAVSSALTKVQELRPYIQPAIITASKVSVIYFFYKAGESAFDALGEDDSTGYADSLEYLAKGAICLFASQVLEY